MVPTLHKVIPPQKKIARVGFPHDLICLCCFCSYRSSGTPLLQLRLTQTAPGPPKPQGNLGRAENPSRAISEGIFDWSAGTIGFRG